MRPVRSAITAILLCGIAPVAAAQDWRAAADARIEAHRKADLRVVVLGADGKPVEGADVAVRMMRHAFKFGTQVSAGLARAVPRARR